MRRVLMILLSLLLLLAWVSTPEVDAVKKNQDAMIEMAKKEETGIKERYYDKRNRST